MRELSECTPWTKDAIRHLMRKGLLRRGEQWFHFGRRIVFKWAAVVALIESEGQDRLTRDGVDVLKIPMLNGGFAYVPSKEAR